ncbi:MAG: hypothetical protein JRJ64_11160, partial [Deltaproteobacteria bacterium]|nr:hypothetical protein [Deltaproteobacteria bacterium]
RPPNDLNPVSLARAASAESKKLGLSCRVWNKARIEKEGMNLLLAVNKGSAIEPRVIHVVYKPARAKKKVVFVGKGLTFDAGGLCIKPAGSMVDMKCDMAGAASTLGIVFAAARLKLPVGRQDGRGHQHRRRGPIGACRRADVGGAQAQARLHDRPRDPHRCLSGRARSLARRALHRRR